MLPFQRLLPSSSTRSVGVSASFCSTASASHGASVSPPPLFILVSTAATSSHQE